MTGGVIDEGVAGLFANPLDAVERLAAEVAALREELKSIRQYGSDTLSGRAGGSADRDWYREGVREMTKRARAAIDAARKDWAVNMARLEAESESDPTLPIGASRKEQP